METVYLLQLMATDTLEENITIASTLDKKKAYEIVKKSDSNLIDTSEDAIKFLESYDIPIVNYEVELEENIENFGKLELIYSQVPLC